MQRVGSSHCFVCYIHTTWKLKKDREQQEQVARKYRVRAPQNVESPIKKMREEMAKPDFQIDDDLIKSPKRGLGLSVSFSLPGGQHQQQDNYSLHTLGTKDYGRGSGPAGALLPEVQVGDTPLKTEQRKNRTSTRRSPYQKAVYPGVKGASPANLGMIPENYLHASGPGAAQKGTFNTIPAKRGGGPPGGPPTGGSSTFGGDSSAYADVLQATVQSNASKESFTYASNVRVDQHLLHASQTKAKPNGITGRESAAELLALSEERVERASEGQHKTPRGGPPPERKVPPVPILTEEEKEMQRREEALLKKLVRETPKELANYTKERHLKRLGEYLSPRSQKKTRHTVADPVHSELLRRHVSGVPVALSPTPRPPIGLNRKNTFPVSVAEVAKMDARVMLNTAHERLHEVGDFEKKMAELVVVFTVSRSYCRTGLDAGSSSSTCSIAPIKCMLQVTIIYVCRRH